MYAPNTPTDRDGSVDNTIEGDTVEVECGRASSNTRQTTTSAHVPPLTSIIVRRLGSGQANQPASSEP